LFFCRDSENDLIFSVLTLKIGSEKNRKLSSKIGKISYDFKLDTPLTQPAIRTCLRLLLILLLLLLLLLFLFLLLLLPLLLLPSR
jgi:hypothetical protein